MKVRDEIEKFAAYSGQAFRTRLVCWLLTLTLTTLRRKNKMLQCKLSGSYAVNPGQYGRPDYDAGVDHDLIVGFDEVSTSALPRADLTIEEIGLLVGTHKFKFTSNPGLIRVFRHNRKEVWTKYSQAGILIAPVGTEDWKPMQKEVTHA